MTVVDMIFLAIIIGYVFIGANRGGIRSVGGLIAMVVSWVIARSLAESVTVSLFNRFGLESYIGSMLSPLAEGIQGNDWLTGGSELGRFFAFPVNDVSIQSQAYSTSQPCDSVSCSQPCLYSQSQ